MKSVGAELPGRPILSVSSEELRLPEDFYVQNLEGLILKLSATPRDAQVSSNSAARHGNVNAIPTG